MSSLRLGCLFFALTTTAGLASAQTPPAPEPGSSPSANHAVRADDLALGRPLATPLPNPTAAPSSASDGSQIVAPELAQSAVVQRQPVVGATPPSVSDSPDPSEVESSGLPKRLPYNGEAEMPGYQRQEQRRWWMIAVGGALFGLGYVGGIAVGADHDFRDGLGFTAIPLAGPWVALGVHEQDCDNVTFECEGVDDESLAGVGVVQGIGGVLLAIGLATTREVWVRNDVAWSVRPVVGQERSGLLLSGTF